MDKDYAKKMAVKKDTAPTSDANHQTPSGSVKRPGPPDVGDDAWLPS